MEISHKYVYPSIDDEIYLNYRNDLPFGVINQEQHNPPPVSYDCASDTKGAYELTKTSIFCGCHVKAFTVLFLSISFMSYCFKYSYYSLDWEVYSVFALLGRGTFYDNRDGRIALFLIQGFIMTCLLASVVSNKRIYLLPSRIYQTILILLQIVCVAMYTGYAIIGNLGDYHEHIAVLYLESYGSPYINEMINRGPVTISITIALIQIVFLLFNLFILAILDSFNAYLKLRAEYYKVVITEQNVTI